MVRLFFVGLFSFLPCCLGFREAFDQTHQSPPTPPCNTTTHDETFVPDAVLIYTVQNITQTSCVADKAVVLINGTSPGPELRLREGSTSWIRVYNNIADQNVTVHWHGLSMAVSPWSDGTPFASQWPVAPGNYFDYEINVPMGMAGTYFYHSHVGFQAVSATGPLIVEDTGKPPYQYDEERIIFLTDVFSSTDDVITTGLKSNPFVWSGETSMLLVNGKGAGTKNVTAGDFCSSPLSVINVDPKKNHPNFTVIEADGQYTQPHETDHIQIGSGQRFSILLKTLDGLAPQDFYIQLESRDRPTVTRSYAILRYGNSIADTTPPKSAPLELPPTDRNWLEYQLAPLVPNNFPQLSEVTRRVYVNVHQLAQNGKLTWNEDGYPWFEDYPQEPYLVSLIKNDGVEFPNYERALQNGGIDPVTRAFPAMIGEVLEVVVQNTGATSGGLDFHPFHAHGSHYWDIGSGNGTYDINANEERLKGTSPVLRDTTMLYQYEKFTTPNITMGWRAWRLRIDEPGVWMIHCHILQHMVMGMQTVWVMGNRSELMSKVRAPEVSGYLTYGGDVYGNKTNFPSGVVHFQDNWAQTQ